VNAETPSEPGFDEALQFDAESLGLTIDSISMRKFAPSDDFDANLIEQIVSLTNNPDDELIRANTRDEVRFGSVEAVNEWLAKGREIMVLTYSDDDGEDLIAALAWYGPSDPPSELRTEDSEVKHFDIANPITTAFRIYPPFRGNIRRLGHDFFKNMLSAIVDEDTSRTAWAETDRDNKAMQHIFDTTGMKRMGINPENDRFIYAVADNEPLDKPVDGSPVEKYGEALQYSAELPTIDSFNRLSYSANDKIPEYIIDQILIKTHDEDDALISSNTSDVSRFKDREAIDSWLKKGREIRILTDADGNLVSLAWFGDAEPPEIEDLDGNQIDLDLKNPVTRAIRIYPPYRGNILRLTDDALGMITSEIINRQPHPGSIWIETSYDNIALQRKLPRLGMEFAGVNRKTGKWVFVLRNKSQEDTE